MRSAIFNSDRSSPNKSGIRARHASASPRLPTTSTSSGSGPAQVGKVKKLSDIKKGKSSSPYIGSPRRMVNWNLDEMIAAYHDGKALPPLLSPTLPGIDRETDKDLDEVPLIHLSPPKPTKKPSTRPEIVSPGKKKSRIKWVNKLDDSRPRFPLRFTYNAQKYKPVQKQEHIGLGISEKSRLAPSEKLRPASVEKPRPTPVDKTRPSTPRPTTPIQRPISKPSTPVQKLQPKKNVSDTEKKIPKKDNEQKPRESEAEQKPSVPEDFVRMKTHWIKVAKETKFISDKTEGVLSIIMGLDSLVSFAISYQYDDKSKSRMKIAPSDRYWLLLAEDINYFIKKIQRSYLSDKKFAPIEPHLQCIVGVLYQFNVMVSRHINSIYETTINQEPDSTKKVPFYQKIINNSHMVDDCIRQAEVICPRIDTFIRTRFPEVWNKKSKQLVSDVNMIPIDHGYYLPINSYTHLSEFTKFFYHLLNEFITIYNNVYKEDLIYSLKSGSLPNQL